MLSPDRSAPMRLRYVVEGPPVPKGRPRTTKAGHVYTPKETRAYERLAREAAQRALAEAGDVLAWPMRATYHVTVRVYCATARRPDSDNVFKSIVDAAIGVLWEDDKDVGGTFWPASVSGNPRVEVDVVARDPIALVYHLDEHREEIRRAAEVFLDSRSPMLEARSLAALTSLLGQDGGFFGRAASRLLTERDDLRARLDAMTNQAVMASGRRATIVDASEDVEKLRAALEKAERERDDALAKLCSMQVDVERTADRDRWYDEAVRLKDDVVKLRAALEKAERGRDEARSIMGDAYHAMARWGADEDGIADDAWPAFERIAMVLAWPVNHSRGTTPAAPHVHAELRTLRTRLSEAAQDCRDLIDGPNGYAARNTWLCEAAEILGVLAPERIFEVPAVVRKLRARVAELEAAMPTDEERDAIAACIEHSAPSMEPTDPRTRRLARPALARLDAARGGSNG